MISFKNFALKHRHLLTSAGNIRLRYVIGILVICVLVISFYPSSDHPVREQISDRHNPQPTIMAEKTYSDDPEEAGRGLDPYYARIGLKPEYILPPRWTKLIEVEAGDTLGEVMEETGLTGEDYLAAMKALQEHFDPRELMPGQKIEVDFINVDNTGQWDVVNYRIDGLRSVSLKRDKDGGVIGEKIEKQVHVKTHAARTSVQTSLYADLAKAGVPDGVINRLIKAYSWSVDFQRDIWGGEDIELFYETRETDDGEWMRSGRLLYAKLTIRGKELPMYLFEKDKGFPSFYEPNGQSVKKALLKTPVDGARISSGYGMRKHPVLGYSKMHKGLDFAAPTGTPIYAAGDGVVQRANRFSSYGNYIKIRHNDKYSTAYAHLHKIAKGIRKGARVKQGQVIGTVGSTGRSTGPHLHYEVIVNGKQVNPHSIDLPIGEKLKGNDLTKFKAEMATIAANFKNAIGDKQ
jgi:murein DD-endopeptidase MepM/ murein hydrolase activator NlpD